jgi:LPXTG-site transpeptidase (sortase) family protein
MAFAVVGLVLLFSGQIRTFIIHQWHTETPTAQTVITTSSTTGLSRLAPVRIQIPSIKLDTTFVPPLTLNADKTVSVPDNYTQVGWYSGGAAPGEVGPSVILGHVDSKAGPAVFYSLGQVKVGDKVQITRTDGSIATFEITELHRYLQSDFPTLDVYGPTNYPALRLVTCTGVYDHGIQRYSHNLVVYGKLVQ